MCIRDRDFIEDTREKEQREVVLEAVFGLPRKYRMPVYLYYYEEYSVAEIAGILGRNPSTIQTQLDRARRKLCLLYTSTQIEQAERGRRMQNKLLEVKLLKKIYGKNEGPTTALNGISFQVLDGEFLGIMGSSGSGKTTLLNCIATMVTPTEGHILLKREDISNLKGSRLARFRGDVYKRQGSYHWWKHFWSVVWREDFSIYYCYCL